MPLTAKEKMRRYRERLKNENPEKYEEQRKKNLARIKSKKKKISEMTQAEAEAKRKEWRDEKRISRQRRHDIGRPSPLRENMSNSISDNVGSDTAENNNKTKKLQSKLKLSLKQNKNMKSQIDKLKTKLERYKKRIQRTQQQAIKSIASLQKTLDIVKARNEILESAIKTGFSSCTKHSEKRLLKRIVHNSKNKQYTSRVLGLKVTARLKPKRARNTEITEIKEFFLRDDVSRITSGKKECRVENKNKQQIRYLIDSIPNLYKKYKAESLAKRVRYYGITTFYKNKPFFVLSPHIQSRSTCLCEKHENIKFKYESLRKHRIINKDFDELLKNLVCDPKNIQCMYNVCKKCKNKAPKFSADQDDKMVNWCQWERQDHVYIKDGATKHTKKTVRTIKTNTVKELINDFSRDIIIFKKHHFNNIHQQKEYLSLVSNIKATEAVIVCDFSENYQCKLTEEIQSMHFGASKSQISLHTGMVYLGNKSQSFCTISNNLSHQPPSIWAHLTPILTLVKEMCSDINVIHFYSDGPTSQYRQKYNFFLHNLFTKELNLSYSTWSFFEAGHGKSVADGIGGTIKRMLDFKVCHGININNASDAYEALKQTKTTIRVQLIEEETINEIANKIVGNIRVLRGTMKVHQIIAFGGVKINYRDISCFCEPLRGKCSCFSVGEHTLQILPSTVELDEADLLQDLVELGLPSPSPSFTPIEPLIVDLSSAEMDETTSCNAVDTEGIKGFLDTSDSKLDIDKLPLIILPDKVSTCPGPSSIINSTVRNTSKYPSNTRAKFQYCNKCSCSIFGKVAKCMACKKIYCEDCVGGGPTFFDYICDRCFQDSEDNP